jgi:hypothetical protein
MTQVLQHDYGKSRVTLLEIRAAIKAVKATKAVTVVSGEQSGVKAAKKAASTKSRKGA